MHVHEATPPAVEATIGGFEAATQEMLVPILLYKSLFLGEWFQTLVRIERDEAKRNALRAMSQDTLREAIEVLAVVRDWDAMPRQAQPSETLLDRLGRHIVHDLMDFKERSTEALMLAAFRAPTVALRDRVVALADRDRVHADELRALLGLARVREAEARPHPEDDAPPLGAHDRRAVSGMLATNLSRNLDALRARGQTPERLVVSHVALRHLRDEGRVAPDGTILGLAVDVDFGWEGECYAVLTEERASVAEMASLRQRPPPKGAASG